MSTKDKQINDGGPAFPVLNSSDGVNLSAQYFGMSLRDYFATGAMQSYLIETEPGSLLDPDFIDRNGIRLADKVAARSYAFADAMLKARSL
jgi:hypothetical protein